MDFDFDNRQKLKKVSIKVIGVGRAGCNVVSSLNLNPESVDEIIYIHTDKNFLKQLEGGTKISIESHHTGTNGEPTLGYTSAEAHKEAIINCLTDTTLVFLVAGLGGGTGSGSSDFISKIISSLGITSIAFVSLPFDFEGERKKRIALTSLKKIKQSMNTTIVIKNDLLLGVTLKDNIFSGANNLMSESIKGLSSLLNVDGYINIDFADVRSVLDYSSYSVFGYGVGEGKNRVKKAIDEIFNNPLLKEFRVYDSGSFLVNVTSARKGFSIGEFNQIMEYIDGIASEDSEKIMGMSFDENLDDKVIIHVYFGSIKNIDLPEFSALDEIEIVRSISFSPEHLQSGISILSYFGDVIKQQYSDIDVKITIEQSGNLVCLIIRTLDGNTTKIEKSLMEYGQVVKGKLQPSDILENNLDIEKLKIKLELSALELKQNERIQALYQDRSSEQGKRILTLEEQVTSLHKIIATNLSSTPELIKLQSSLAKSQNKNLQKSIKVLESFISNNFNERKDGDKVKNLVKKIQKEDISFFNNLENIFFNLGYSVSGNALYSFIVSAVNALPK